MAWPPTTHQDVQDEVTALRTHTHGVTDLTATGTRDATTYLRGDNTWATPSGGGGGVDQATVDAVASPRLPVFGVPVGGWITSPFASVSGNAWPNGELNLGQMWLPAGTYDAVAFHIYQAGSTGAVAKVVAYANNGGLLGSLLLDTATVAVTTTGQKQITGLSLVAPAGGLALWAGAVNQGGAATTAQHARTGNVNAQQVFPTGNPILTEGGMPIWQVGGVTGAAPTTVTGPTRWFNSSILAFRRSA